MGRELTPELARRGHRLGDVGEQGCRRGVGLERHAPGQHLVGDDRHGRHVLRRPHHGARARQAAHRAHQLGEAEVGQHRSPVGVEQDVRGLDVAVQDAVRMRVAESARYPLQQRHHFLQVHRGAHPFGERAALDQLEHEEGNPVLVAEVEDLEDVGMLETGDRPRLLLEPLAIGRFVGEDVGQDLDRHVAIEGGVVGAVDRSHAATTDSLQDPVRTEALAFVGAHPIQPTRRKTATAGGRAIRPVDRPSTASAKSRCGDQASAALACSAPHAALSSIKQPRSLRSKRKKQLLKARLPEGPIPYPGG